MNCLYPKSTTIFIMAVTLMLSACSSPEEDVSLDKEVVRPVKLITINDTDAINIRRFPAEIKAGKEADLAFRVGGQLQELNIVSGQRVKKGDQLAALDPTDFELQVELAKANQELAAAQFKRVQSMLKQAATSKSQYDETKATLDQANNSLQSAINQLKYTKLYAPFDGVIAQVSTENFQYVSAAATLIHMQDISNLDVEFQVPETLVVSIKSTDSNYMPDIIVDVAPDDVFHGIYKEHNTVPDATTMAYDVTLHLLRDDSNKHTLLPGMTANVDIDLSKLLGSEKHIVVPVEAVLLHEDTITGKTSSTVWVYQKNTNMVEAREVTLGNLQGNEIEILTGLNAGEQIVAAGVHTLTSSMKVRPWMRERGI